MFKFYARKKKFVWMAVCAAALLALAGASGAHATSNLSGKVYVDYNSDGFFNITSTVTLPAVDQSLAGVEVRVFDTQGRNVTPGGVQVTDANGDYAFTTVVTDTTTGPYRLEFTPPAGYQPGPVGQNNASTVRFISGAASGLDLGVIRPSEYCQANPRLITSCYVQGDAITGTYSGESVIVSHPYEADTDTRAGEQMEALSYQAGTTWGLAYQRATRTLFAAAYLKRLAGFGPGIINDPLSDGSGTIYKLTPDGSPDGTPYLDLDVYFNDANLTGSALHSNLDGPAAFDLAAYDQVGKAALGDLDMGEDDRTLWVVNLADQKLYRIQNVDPTHPPVPGDGNITSYGPPNPSPACGTGGVYRPFGLKPHNGKIYVGGVCTEEGSSIITATAELRAIVFAFDPATTTFTQVLDFPLNYPRGCADRYGYPALPTPCRGSITDGSYADWRPYTSTLPASFPAGYAGGYTAYPQPMLTDIEFDGNDMIIGLRDRFADQLGYHDPGPAGGQNFVSTPAGDILRACWNTGSGNWELEANGNCGGTTTAGVGNEQGPGNGEYYFGDFIDAPPPDGVGHDELSLGGVVQVPGYPEVALTASDPYLAFQAGTIQLADRGAAAGSRVRRYQIYNTLVLSGTFAKANGLGDLEALCDAAPLEIGNRVWWDTNSSPNGRQDPGEPGMDGLTLELWVTSGVSETLVATTTTASGGQYYFSFEGDPAKDGVNGLADQVWLNGYSHILPNTNYHVRLPNWSTEVKAWAVANAALASDATVYVTDQFKGGAINGTVRDSDAYADGTAAAAAVDTGSAGANNHTFDLGFTGTAPTNIGLAELNAQANHIPATLLIPIGLLGLAGAMGLIWFAVRRAQRAASRRA